MLIINSFLQKENTFPPKPAQQQKHTVCRKWPRNWSEGMSWMWGNCKVICVWFSEFPRLCSEEQVWAVWPQNPRGTLATADCQNYSGRRWHFGHCRVCCQQHLWGDDDSHCDHANCGGGDADCCYGDGNSCGGGDGADDSGENDWDYVDAVVYPAAAAYNHIYAYKTIRTKQDRYHVDCCGVVSNYRDQWWWW